MKAGRFDEILRARGYKRILCGNNENEVVIFVKTHRYNTSMCTVEKDSHKKGQVMTFNIASQVSLDPEVQREIEFDRSYLVKEANAIGAAFEKLRELKSPKHIYCF